VTLSKPGKKEVATRIIAPDAATAETPAKNRAATREVPASEWSASAEDVTGDAGNS
jgi:hypothetical protein